MRILLLKSLLLCTNSPSFLPILCGILFVFAEDLFLPWICFWPDFDVFCFCRGILFVSAVDLFLPWIPLFLFLLPFCFCLFFSLVPSIISHEIRKTWEFFWKKSIVFLKISIVFLFFSEMLRSYHTFKCACERKSMPSINPSAWFFSLLYLRKGRGLSMKNSWKRGKM